MSGLRVGSARADALAERVVAEVELLDERLVDDRDLRRADGIGARELAAGASAAIPIVLRNPGPTMLSDAVVLVSGPASKPSTTRLLFQLSPASTGTTVATTLDDAGRARRARLRCARTVPRALGAYSAFSSGAMLKSTR